MKPSGFALALVTAAATALAGCASEQAPDPPSSGVREEHDRPQIVERTAVGRGETGATILRRPGPPDGRPVVVFLHGWSAIQPERYGPWLRHLAERGSIVVYPTYQRAPFFDVQTPLHNAVAGIRAAFETLGAGVGPVVVAGHSAGGALAADVAAVARRSELPTPAAIYAVYPGRGLRGIPLRLATPDATGIDPRTRVLALAGAGDTVVGAEPARLIVATAPVPDGRRELRLVTDPAVADHQAPHRFGPPEQATFWRPLDHLLRRAVAGA